MSSSSIKHRRIKKMEQKNYHVPKKPRSYDYYQKKTVRVTEDGLDQCFGRKKKVVVITTDEPVDEIIIRVKKGGCFNEEN